MSVCDFLKCTLTELRGKIDNPADYYLILAYLHERGERIQHETGAPPKPNPRVRRR